MGSLESRLKELEKLNQELTDCKYRSESATREVTARLSSTSEVSSMEYLHVVCCTIGCVQCFMYTHVKCLL